MTLEELKNCAGFTVRVSLNGKDALAQIESRFSVDGLPHLACPPPSGEDWEDLVLLPISKEVAAKISLNGARSLSSAINPVSDGSRNFRYTE